MSNENLCCCFCSIDSIEQYTIDRIGLDAIHRYEQSDWGLKCSLCDRFVCTDCLLEIVSKFSTPVQRKDKWCRVVNRFLHQGFFPNHFVGNCCELKVKQQKLGLDKPEVFPVIKETRFDGHLYLPEFSLILDSPFDCVDIHGFGGSEKLAPVWHSVFSHKAAELFHQNKLTPDGREARLIDHGEPLLLEIALPYSDKKIKVRCISIDIVVGTPRRLTPTHNVHFSSTVKS